MHVGIDVGATRLHVAVLNDAGHFVDGFVTEPDATRELEKKLGTATTIAVDAPSSLSAAPHHDDDTLSPKFRTARCAEIALGRVHRVWVPWVTPTPHDALPPWMAVGLELFRAFGRSFATVIEVFPYAGYRALAGGRTLPSKATAAGLRARAELLEEQGVDVPALQMRSHDSLDACLAALIALRRSTGEATRVTCGHDGSSIWLP